MTSRSERLRYTFLLRWMSLEWEHTRTSRILTPLGEAIKAGGNTLDRISETDDPEWVESVVADETAVVEDLLGASFVVCQTFITTVVSRVYRAHDIHMNQGNGQPLQTTTRNKTSILRFGCPTVRETGYTAVEILDGFANYWKHREEWTRGVWGDPSGAQLGTIRVIRAAGAEEGSNGNLRRGSELLGNTTYSDVQMFSNVLGTWSRALHAAYAQEFSTLI